MSKNLLDSPSTQHYCCVMIPKFDDMGFLPPGIHESTWDEFSSRFNFSPRREWLLIGLKKALLQLQYSGCKKVFIDGSFVTLKQEPDDYDGCWEANGVDIKKLDPVFLQFDDRRIKQKLKYRGELFISNMQEMGLGICFLDFFQMRKDSNDKKGIVSINLGELR